MCTRFLMKGSACWALSAFVSTIDGTEKKEARKQMSTIKLKQKVLKVLMVTFMLSVLGYQCIRNTTTAFAENMSFSVTPVIPENQNDKSKTYFDLEMKPEQKEILEVVIKNNTEKEIVVEVHANTAFTNDNGVADYNQSERTDVDDTLKTPFSEIATPQLEEVTIPASGQTVVKVDIKMPKEEYDGLILGGLHFSEKTAETTETNEGGVQIKNNFAYVIGVSLRETTKEVKTNLELHSVVPEQINYRNVVTANIQNTEAEIVRDLSVDAKIYTEHGKDVLHQTQKADMRMVPNSNFNFPISWDNKEFKAGTYRLELDANGDGEAYHWVKYFTIDGKEAKKLNETAVELEKESKLRFYILVAALVIILLLVLLIVITFRKKKTEETAVKKVENSKSKKTKKKKVKK